MTQEVLWVHVAATWMMVGVIWVIQILHYPLFSHVGTESFALYHAQHTAKISLIVIPVMLLEVATCLWLLSAAPPQISSFSLWFSATLLSVIWLSTFLSQVPLHNRLSGGFSAEAHHLLVLGNWVRTVGWTLRGCLVLGWLKLPPA